MFRDIKEFPPITRRIKKLVDEHCGGNVRQFSLNMGMTDSVRINRLFKRDKRNNEFPLPSTEIVIMISNTYKVSTDWILLGKDTINDNVPVNNITIEKHCVSGENNLIGDNNNIEGGELLQLVKTQQEQITKLIGLLYANPQTGVGETHS